MSRRKNPLIPEVSEQKSEVSSQKAPSTPSVIDGLFFQFRPETEKDNKNQRNPRNLCQKTSLAEKTIEDILLHFGETKKVALSRYRQFVEKGIKHGRREDLQGGGLIRSSGVDKAGLLGLKEEEREKGDARILGSGDFVSDVLQHANEDADREKGPNISLTELISRVCKEFDIKIGALMLDIRRAPYTQIRAIISYFSIHELGYRGSDVAKALNLSRASVSKSKSRGKNLIDRNQHLWDLLKTS